MIIKSDIDDHDDRDDDDDPDGIILRRKKGNTVAPSMSTKLGGVR